MGSEPTLIIQAVVATLVAVNTAIATRTDVPWWVGVAISALIVGLGALLTRSQVTPNSKAAATTLASAPESGDLKPIKEPTADLEQGPDPVPEELDSDEWLAARQPPADTKGSGA